jgi:hypothetical protein
MARLRRLFVDRRSLLLILILAVLLRLAGLGWRSLWLDEVLSIRQAARPLSEIWAGTGELRHPPLYYLLLHFWLRLGEGEAVIRLLSALFSLATVGLVYGLGRGVDRDRPETALLAAALLALAPLDLWYAQEARMYALVAACGALTALGLLLPGRRGAGLVLVGATIGLYADYTFVPLLLGLTAVWAGVALRAYFPSLGGGRGTGKGGLGIVRSAVPPHPNPLPPKGGEGRAKVVAVVLALVLYGPIWPRVVRLVQTMNDVHIVVRVGEVTGLPRLPTAFFVAVLLLGALFTAAAGYWLWPRLSRPAWQRRWGWGLLVLFALLTVATPVPRLYSLKRIVVTGWPLLTLAAAYLAVRLTGRRGQALLLTLSLAAALWVLATPKDDWRSAAAFVESRAAPSDLVWVDPFLFGLPYGYYAGAPAEHGTIDALDARAGRSTGVWLVITRFPGRPIPETPAEKYLEYWWELREQQRFYRVEVRYYQMRSPGDGG